MTDAADMLKKRTDAELLEQDRARAGARAQTSEQKKIIKALERELRDSNVRTAYLDALAAAPDPKPHRIEAARPKKGQRHSNSATYVMMASDWHVGERVRPETVGWRNEYNPEIAQERARKFWHSNLTMLNAARAAWDVRQGILWLGGDLITGYIHEEYEEENFLSPTEESLLAYEMIVSGIKTLLAESDLEHILIPTSHGNHGRTMKKPRVSTAAKNSFEWLLYQLLSRTFKDEPRVTFQIANGYHNLVDVYGFRVRFHHGDAIKYAGGVGGISVPVNRRIGRQAKADIYPVRLDVIGHYHQLQSPKDFMVNGSLIGWNAYAEFIGCGYEPAMQGSFVIDERYKLVSNFNPIIVEKRG
jgi:hypothetical protein